jgi:hypothetical protein
LIFTRHNETLLGGVTSVLRDDDYTYYSNLEWPKRSRRDSKYGILFRGCFAHVIDVIGNIPNAYKPRLRVVLEDGHKNAPDTARMKRKPTAADSSRARVPCLARAHARVLVEKLFVSLSSERGLR